MAKRKRTVDLDAPRKGVRRYGSKSNYSEDMLQRALLEISAGEVSERLASIKYGIPRNTIRNKRKKNHAKKVGRPQVFSPEEEEAFVNHIIAVSEMGLPVGIYDVRCIAGGYLRRKGRNVEQFKDNIPGWDWGQNFFHRHKDRLTQRFETNIRQKRAQVNAEVLNMFFDKFSVEADGIPPSHIYNYDETGFHDIPSKKKVLFPRGCRHPDRIRNSTKSCYTVLFCGNAAGDFIPPYLIMKGEKKFTDWLRGGPENARLNNSKSGWIDSGVFDDWFENHFLRSISGLEGPKILLGDNLSSHITLASLRLAEEHEVKFIFFPPNASHILQPLDVGYFSSLKTTWRKVLATWRATKPGKKTIAMPKATFSQLLARTLEIGIEQAGGNLKKGFQASGIYPLNKTRVLDSLPSYATQGSTQEDIGAEFREYLEKIRTEDLGVIQRQNRYALPVTPGQSVSLQEVENYYDTREAALRGRSRTRGGRARTSSVRTIGRNITSTIRPSTSSSLDETNSALLLELTDLSGNREATLDLERDEQLSSHEEDDDNDDDNEGESTIITTLPIDQTFSVNDFVVVCYNDEFFPGQVELAEGGRYEVKCMERFGGHYWKWPAKEDKLWYDSTEILKKVDLASITTVSSRRSIFKIDEDLL